MERLEFVVLGSQGDEYRITFERNEMNLNVFCTCAAGENRLYCKHRFALMNGEYERVIVGDEVKLARVKAVMQGTDLEQAYKGLVAADIVHAEAKRKLDIAKKLVAKAMYN